MFDIAPLGQAPKEPHRVVMVAHDDAQILDITGPLEVLAGASDFLTGDTPAYEISLVAKRAGKISTSCGIYLHTDQSFKDFSKQDRKSIDTIMVCGGPGTSSAVRDEELTAFVRDVSKTAQRAISICSGAFVLARLGLLDGRRATTHWRLCEQLASHYPTTHVDPDAIYVRDGHVWTSAGVTSGMDLALALIEEDWGHEVALAVARSRVMYMIRPGGQSQYSAHLIAQGTTDSPMADVLEWILENVGQPITVPVLADRACMSERSFLRKFKAATGTTPARFVESARIEAARRRLEREGAPVDCVAHSTGFGNAERMRRAFQRHLGVSPADYRNRFYVPPTQSTLSTAIPV